jgi:Cyclic nucleotide-binding domain
MPPSGGRQKLSTALLGVTVTVTCNGFRCPRPPCEQIVRTNCSGLMAQSAVTSDTAPPRGGFDLHSFARGHGGIVTYPLPRGSRLFSQDEAVSDLFYLDQGQIQLSVTSIPGPVAIVGVLMAGDFCGESCMAGAAKQVATATCIAEPYSRTLRSPSFASLISWSDRLA